MNDRFTRRHFLRLGGLAAGSLYLTSLSPVGATARVRAVRQQLVRRGAPKNVVIIGAGLAGLTAAYELTEAGHDVTILEAQTRPGGRVRTIRAPFADGLYAEVGAGRIPDNHDWTLKYVEQFGLELAPFYPTSQRFTTFLRDTRIPVPLGTPPDLSQFPVELTAEERAMGLDGLFEKAFAEVLAQTHQSIWPPESLKPYDQMTIGAFLATRGFSPDVTEALGFQAFEGHSALEVIGLLGSGHGGKVMSKTVGGNDRLPNAFGDTACRQDSLWRGRRSHRAEWGGRSRDLSGSRPLPDRHRR